MASGLFFFFLCSCFLLEAVIGGTGRSPIGSFTVDKDRRKEIRITSFGFVEGGYYSIEITGWKLQADDVADSNLENGNGNGNGNGSSPTKSLPPIGIYTRRSFTASDATIDVISFCSQITTDLTSILNNNSHFYPFDLPFENWTINQTIKAKEEGLWTSSLINCRSNVAISCSISHEQHNPGPEYVSVGEAPLPMVFGMLAIAYFIAALVWGYQLLRKQDSKVLWPHWLMFALVIIKTMTLIFISLKYYYLKKGYNAEGWAITYYIFTFLRGSISFIILLLIGTGWIFIKPFLSSRDKKIFIIVIPLQIISNVAQVIISETEQGSGSWDFWSMVFPALDFVCCVLILAPILQTRRHLEQAQPDGKVEQLRQKYRVWGQFYVLTIAYVYFTRIVVLLLVAALPYYIIWLSDFFCELSTFLFYLIVGYKFRPVPNNPYLAVETDDETDNRNEIPMESLGGSISHKRKPASNPTEP